MNEAEIKAAVFKLLKKIAPETDPSKIPPQENLREALEIDSFDFLTFIVGLKEEVGVEVPESDYNQLTTLEDVFEYLSARAHR